MHREFQSARHTKMENLLSMMPKAIHHPIFIHRSCLMLYAQQKWSRESSIPLNGEYPTKQGIDYYLHSQCISHRLLA